MSAPRPDLSSGPQKHSLTLRGHRTSVSLEPLFWATFQEIAAKMERSVNQLAAEIDAKRTPDLGLASAIRVFCLSHFRHQPPQD